MLVGEADGGVVKGDLFEAGNGEKNVRVCDGATRSWAERVRECLVAARREYMALFD